MEHGWLAFLFRGLVQTLQTTDTLVRQQGESRCEGIDGSRMRGTHSSPNLNMVVEEGEDAASSAEDIDLMLFQRGGTDEDNSQSETRPGQEGPGGWVF